jgi:tetratricopeptide (TPR) repeat protein
MSRPSATKRIDKLFEQEKWKEARKVILAELEKDPESHWLLTRLAATHYEERDYQAAIEWGMKAFERAPRCPLVLWDLAGALQMSGEDERALAIYEGLLKRGIKRIAEDECGEGRAWATALLTDCLFRMGESFIAVGRTKAAQAAFQRYLVLRGRGAESIYSAEEAVKELAKLGHARNPNIEKELKGARQELAAAK